MCIMCRQEPMHALQTRIERVASFELGNRVDLIVLHNFIYTTMLFFKATLDQGVGYQEGYRKI